MNAKTTGTRREQSLEWLTTNIIRVAWIISVVFSLTTFFLLLGLSSSSPFQYSRNSHKSNNDNNSPLITSMRVTAGATFTLPTTTPSGTFLQPSFLYDSDVILQAVDRSTQQQPTPFSLYHSSSRWRKDTEDSTRSCPNLTGEPIVVSDSVLVAFTSEHGEYQYLQFPQLHQGSTIQYKVQVVNGGDDDATIYGDDDAVEDINEINDNGVNDDYYTVDNNDGDEEDDRIWWYIMKGDSRDWLYRDRSADSVSSTLQLRDEEVVVKGIVGGEDDDNYYTFNQYNNDDDNNEAFAWTYRVGTATNTFALAYGNGHRNFLQGGQQTMLQIDYTVTMTTYNVASYTPVCQTKVEESTTDDKDSYCTVPLLQNFNDASIQDCWIVVPEALNSNDDDNYDASSGYESILLQMETERDWSAIVGLSALPLLLGSLFHLYSSRSCLLRNTPKIIVQKLRNSSKETDATVNDEKNSRISSGGTPRSASSQDARATPLL